MTDSNTQSDVVTALEEGYYKRVFLTLESSVAGYQEAAKGCWHGDELIPNADLSHAVNNLAASLYHAREAIRVLSLQEQSNAKD